MTAQRSINTLKRGLIAAGLTCMLGLPLAAQEAEKAAEAPQFEESNFLKSLDLLLTEQAVRRQDKRKDALGDLRLSLNPVPDIHQGGFRGSLSQEGRTKDQDYFYLNDGSDAGDSEASGLLSLPDFSSLLAPGGETRTYLERSNANVSEGRVGLLFGNRVRPDGSVDRGLEIALQSAYSLIGNADSPLADYPTSEQTAERAYDLGLSIGYSGFNLDASLQRDWSPFRSQGEGYELGFSYQATSWSARLAWNAYKSGSDLEGLENEERKFISLELGANLKLSDRFGLSGGVRYYDYGSRHLISAAQGDSSQMVFIGGRLRF